MTGSSTSCSSPLCERRAFTAADVVALYLHRGAFEPQLADEDSEQDERLAGVVMRPPDSRRGRSSLSGSGTSVSNWVISSLRPHCGRRSLLRLSPSRLRRRATGRLWLGDLGRLGALREKPLPSSPMGRCAVQRGRRSFLANGAKNQEAACASSTPPGSQIVVPVPCVSSVSGTVTRRANPAR